MKYYIHFFLTVLAFSTSAHAYEPKIEIFEQFDDLKMVAFISMKDIDNSPEWDPNLSAPPLTITEAIQAVKNFIKKSDISNPIKEIEIRTVPKHEEHWHYLIKIANESKKSKYDIYVILMNGLVIPAIIEPQGYK